MSCIALNALLELIWTIYWTPNCTHTISFVILQQ